MTGAWLLLSMIAVLAAYLSSTHQRLWPRMRRYRRALRAAASLGLAASTYCAIAALGLWAGVFAALSACMLSAVALPYLDAWRQPRVAAPAPEGRPDVG